MATYSFTIDPRPADLGGGWRLRLLQDGEEMGGGIFPVDPGAPDKEEAQRGSFAEAEGEGQAWLESRPPLAANN